MSLDTSAAAPTLTAGTFTSTASSVTGQSGEIGTAYLVSSSVTVTDLASITSAADNLWNSATIAAANTNYSIALTGLGQGTYKLYTVDKAGNLSNASANTIDISIPIPLTTGQLILPFTSSEGHVFYIWDYNSNGLADDYFNHNDLDWNFRYASDFVTLNPDATNSDTTSTYRYARIAGASVSLATQTTASGGTMIWTTSAPRADWPKGYYWMADQMATNQHIALTYGSGTFQSFVAVGDANTAIVILELISYLAPPTVALTTDNGSSPTDFITTNAALNVTGADSGNTLEYQINGGAWATSYTAPTADGAYTVKVHQKTAAGYIGADATVAFTLDNSPPTLLSAACTPLDNGMLGTSQNLTITFNENIALAATGVITLKGIDATSPAPDVVIDLSDPVQRAQVSTSGNALIINPANDLALHKQYAVQISNGAVTNMAGLAFDGINNTTTLNFTTDNGLDLGAGKGRLLYKLTSGSYNYYVWDSDNDYVPDLQSHDLIETTFGWGHSDLSSKTVNGVTFYLPQLGELENLNTQIDSDPSLAATFGLWKSTYYWSSTNNGTTGHYTYEFSSNHVYGDADYYPLGVAFVVSNITAPMPALIAVSSNDRGKITTDGVTGPGSYFNFWGWANASTTAATIEIFDDVDLDGVLDPSESLGTTAPFNTGSGWEFAFNGITLGVGTHHLRAQNTVNGLTSAPSSPINYTVDPGPLLTSSTPGDNGTLATVADDLVLTFNTNVERASWGSVTLKGIDTVNPATDIVIQYNDASQLLFSGNTLTINPTGNLQSGKQYAVQISGVMQDTTYGISYAGIADTTTLNFQVL